MTLTVVLLIIGLAFQLCMQQSLAAPAFSASSLRATSALTRSASMPVGRVAASKAASTLLKHSSGTSSALAHSAGSFASRHGPAVKAGAATIATSVATAAVMRVGENVSSKVTGKIDHVMKIPEEQRNPNSGFQQAVSMQQMGMGLSGGMPGYGGMAGY